MNIDLNRKRQVRVLSKLKALKIGGCGINRFWCVYLREFKNNVDVQQYILLWRCCVTNDNMELTSLLGLAVLKHVLTPRIKATHVAFDCMKNYLDAIYDVTVVYEGKDNGGQRRESPTMTGKCVHAPEMPATRCIWCIHMFM